MGLWTEVLYRISNSISKPSFQTWFVDTTAELCDDVIIVKTKNEFAVDWLRERYLSLISETVSEITGKTYKIDFIPEDREVNSISLYEKENSGESEHHGERISEKITDIYNILEAQEQRIIRLEKLLLENKIDVTKNE